MASRKNSSKEISPDQLLKELKSGKGNVAKLITEDDGTEIEIPMWGYAGQIDGLDHTLNVYMKLEDCALFNEHFLQSKYDVTGVADPCENRYVMTIDYTDVPAIAVMAVDDDRLYFYFFSRDAMRSFSNLQESFECNVSDVEGLTSNPLLIAKFKNKKSSLLILSMMAVRKYLLIKGVVRELYDMYDSTSGVVVKVGKNNHISASVVTGNKRPDLPCEGMFGSQVVRPYMDEVLGIKPKHTKRPKADAKIIEKKKAAKEAKEKDDYLKRSGKKYMDFRVSDNVDELEKYINLYDRIVENEIEKTNQEIINEKTTPITRPNDSRIKKIYANTETVIEKDTAKLSEVLDTLDRIGDGLVEHNAPDADIIRIAQLIGMGKDKLRLEKTIEVYKEKKVFKSNVDKKYSTMSGKWKKIYNSLPTIRVQELKLSVSKKEEELIPLKKQIASEKRRKTYLTSKISELDADLQEKREDLATVSAEVGELVEASERKQEELWQQVSELESKRQTLELELNSMESNLKTLKSDYSDAMAPLTLDRSNESAALELLNKEMNMIMAEESLKQQRAQKALLFKKRKQAEYEEVHRNATSKKEQVNAGKDRLAKLDLEIARVEADWQRRISQIEQELAQKRALFEETKQNLRLIEEQLRSEKERVKPHKEELSSVQDSFNKADLLLNEKTNDLQALDEQLRADEETRDKTVAEIDKMKQQIKALEKKAEADEKKSSQIVLPQKESAPSRIEYSHTEAGSGLSYSEGLVACGEGYRIDIPDGFVIKEGAEDRAFIAYRPAKDDPENYWLSDFVIYDGRDLGIGGMNSSYRVAPEYMGLVQSLGGLFGVVSDNSQIVRYMRDELPGGLIIAYEDEVIHVNAILGVEGTFKMMRLQISHVEESAYEEYVQVIESVFDHMTVDNPVPTLERLDDSGFVSMKLTSAKVAEWTSLIDEYKEHLINARNTEQDGVVSAIQAKIKSNSITVDQIKNEIKDMLVAQISYVDKVLCRAEALYTLKRAQNPDKKAELASMSEALGKIIDLTSQHANLDGERIEYTSEFGQKVKKRLNEDPVKVINSILSESESLLNPDLAGSLHDVAEGKELPAKSKQGGNKPSGKTGGRNSVDERLAETAYEELAASLKVSSGGERKMDNSQCKECYWYDGKDLNKYPEACDRYEDIRGTVVLGSSSACPYFWSKAQQEAFESGNIDGLV